MPKAPYYNHLSALWMADYFGVEAYPKEGPTGDQRYYVTWHGRRILEALPPDMKKALKTVGLWPLDGEEIA